MMTVAALASIAAVFTASAELVSEPVSDEAVR